MNNDSTSPATRWGDDHPDRPRAPQGNRPEGQDVPLAHSHRWRGALQDPSASSRLLMWVARIGMAMTTLIVPAWVSLDNFDGPEIRVRAEAILAIRPCFCQQDNSGFVPCSSSGRGSLAMLVGGLEVHSRQTCSEIEARVASAMAP